jgi:hypothetical protein
MADENSGPQIQGKPAKTASAIEKALLGEMAEARIKEFRNKLKELVVARDAAQKVLDGKNAEIKALSEDYSDVLAPE